MRPLYLLATVWLLVVPLLAHAQKGPAPLRRQGAPSRPLAHPAAGAGARILPATLVAPRPDPSDPDAPRILRLQEALKQILRQRPLTAARVGLEVALAQKGQLLFAHNADRLFDPASNEKILTTATALAKLGPEYRYRTVLFGPAPEQDGVIAGDISLRGSGDPSLSTQDLADLASELVRGGVRRVAGGVAVDERSFDRRSGAPLDTGDNHDNLGFAAITLNRNTFKVRILPAPSAGERPAVIVDPPSDYLIVENRATTIASGRSRIRVDTRALHQATVVTVTGRIPEAHAPVVVWRHPQHPTLFAGATLLQILRDLGIDVEGGVHVGRVPDGEEQLAVHESRPLGVIIRTSNKESNNFVAERLFQTVGAELYGAPATAAKGQKAVTEYLQEVGLRPGTFHPTNGSGLAHTNRITPDALVHLLRRLYYDISVAPDFLQSLAVGGIDGTIRERFRGTDAVGLVRAKTGTLSGVSCLSGYVGHKEDVIIFSILVQGFRGRRLHDIRRAQVGMVTAMLRYLRGGEDHGMPELAPPGGAMDIESTDETVDRPQDPEPPPPPTGEPEKQPSAPARKPQEK